MFSMPFCTVGVICDSKSICKPRDGYCTIDTNVYNVTGNFTVKILLCKRRSLENTPFSSELIKIVIVTIS